MQSDIINMSEAPYLLNKGSRKYAAYKETALELRSVKIRPKLRAWERMTYSHLLSIVENGYGTELGLLFNFAVVEIKGRNLEALGDAVDRQRCDVIYEFDSDVWDAPSDPKAPFVDSIQITVPTSQADARVLREMAAELTQSRSGPEA